MYLKQKDMFWAMDKEFVKSIMDIAESESYREGDVLFQEGDPIRPIIFSSCLKAASS